MHLHLGARGKYDTGVFAYNLVNRTFKHGVRLVGTLKSEPDLNVLAILSASSSGLVPAGARTRSRARRRREMDTGVPFRGVNAVPRDIGAVLAVEPILIVQDLATDTGPPGEFYECRERHTSQLVRLERLKKQPCLQLAGHVTPWMHHALPERVSQQVVVDSREWRRRS